jgi:hypothetical protein
MTTKQSCPTCGAPATAPRWERLSPGLVECLIKAIQAVHRKNENRFHWHKDLALTNNESHNFQKLRFHGLIAHYDEDNPKSGEWLITARGGYFLRGEMKVPKAVLVFRNHVKDHAKELVHIDEFRGKVSAFQKEFAYEVPKEKLKKVAQPLFQLAA